MMLPDTSRMLMTRVEESETTWDITKEIVKTPEERGRLTFPISLKQSPYIDVRGNNLTGTIPDNIGNCTSFEILDISYNQISGEIPYNIGFLQVATLSLQGNRLTGKIPEVIGLMQALAVFEVTKKAQEEASEHVRCLEEDLGKLSTSFLLMENGGMMSTNHL
ncbi:unnamed protein product [Camellia sinensis]